MSEPQIETPDDERGFSEWTQTELAQEVVTLHGLLSAAGERVQARCAEVDRLRIELSTEREARVKAERERDDAKKSAEFWMGKECSLRHAIAEQERDLDQSNAEVERLTKDAEEWAQVAANKTHELATLRATREQDKRGLIEQMLSELETLTKGEACDHSAGICWCGTFRIMDAAREFLGCDCEDPRHGMKSNECPIHSEALPALEQDHAEGDLRIARKERWK